MAKGKNTFNLYADMIGVFEKLPDDKAGQLIKHIFKYVNDQEPETNDLILNIAFEPIKAKLKRDLVAWTEKCEKNAENIRKRWNKNNTTVYDRIPSDTKHTDKDKDKDKDIIPKKKHPFSKSPYYDFNVFKEPLLKKGWSIEKIKGYYERAEGYSKANGGRYLDWLAAIQNWERSETKTQTPTKPLIVMDKIYR